MIIHVYIRPLNLLIILVPGCCRRLNFVRCYNSLRITLLKNLKNSGKTLVVVHHDLQTVEEYFDHVVLLNTQVIASGPMKETFTEENLAKTYRSTSKILKV